MISESLVLDAVAVICALMQIGFGAYLLIGARSWIRVVSGAFCLFSPAAFVLIFMLWVWMKATEYA